MSAALSLPLDSAIETARLVGDLNSKWTPHGGQKCVIRAVHRDRKSPTMCESGRKFGKTETAEYVAYRGAIERPGGYYYFAPEQKQAKEIIWASGRLIEFAPKGVIESVNNTEMRIWLTNGGFIKVDGSDNFDAYRGIQPHGAIYDEYRDFRPEFHKVMGPNLAVFGAWLLLIGTPPEQMELEHYDAMLAQCKASGAYFNFPTWTNPHISREWLRKEKAALYARGEGDVWEREYAARRVFGGSNAIFPMFFRATHVQPHAALLAEVRRDAKKLHWQVIADPGNATVFAVLFRAINPYTRKVYHLDEIYEREQANTSTSRIMPRIEAMKEELCPGWEVRGIEWEEIYDEAATWFATESVNSFDVAWTPTQKSLRDKDQGLSLIKDQMLSGLWVASDRCVMLAKEVEGYLKDKNGKPVKKNDHLIDCDRYGNAHSVLDLRPEAEPVPKDIELRRRAFTIEQDLAGESDNDEWDEEELDL